ncbi:hypothetical protein FA15DRAFT_1729 [Coprinopsis marcescibilis]|uniref:Mid2 domain-containing protein n=1 Tax=Coprinopsis marcescibilis TaxID=230819 RepID=A0A5C3LD06_COPMA|nr:hypothetical protein FA15DRAFT_1729 [Coprinopsis marcescibilis]
MLPSGRFVFFSVSLAACVANAFTFDLVPEIPTECGTVIVNWSGGEPPFNLLVIPPSNPLANISIPDESYNPRTRTGSFTYTVRFRRDVQMLFSMSDRTGITAGGITNVLRVGVPTGGATCNTTGTGSPNFFFDLEEDLRQCAPYTFTGYPNATKPITVVGFIPGGSSFEETDPLAGDSFSWFNNYPTGTDITFFVKDANGNNGGTSGIKTVRTSSDSSCVAKAPSTSTNIGAIVGGVVGGLAVIGLVVFGVIFWRKRQNARSEPLAPVLGFNEEAKFGAVGPLAGPSAGPPGVNLAHSHSFSGSVYQPERRNTYYDAMSTSGASGVAPYGVPPTPNYHPASTVYSSDPSTSGASGIAPYGGYQPPQTYVRSEKGRPPPTGEPRQLIVHHDIADAPQAEEPEELPPQYFEGRAPLAGLAASGSSQAVMTGAPPTGDRKR